MTWPPATHQDVQDKIDANVTTISGKADTASLATVATSGDYADLTNKPTIPPPAPVDSVNGETGAVVLSAADVGAQPAGSYATGAQGALADTAVQPGDLATVATTGSYGDLSNQPTIPPPAPVDSVNSKTGAVVLSASDVGALDKATADGLYVAQANAIDLEGVEDDVARMFTGGTQSGITFAYDDTNGVINTTVTPGSVADATTTSKGAIQLAGDLSGTAAAPTVPALANKADTSSLATVATSGSYTDLSSKPTIPTVGAAGAGAGVALSSTDASVTNARTPTAHASTHASGGTDAVTVAQSQVTGLSTALAGKVGSSTVTTIVTLTSSAYTALATKDPATLYVVTP